MATIFQGALSHTQSQILAKTEWFRAQLSVVFSEAH